MMINLLNCHLGYTFFKVYFIDCDIFFDQLYNNELQMQYHNNIFIHKRPMRRFY